MIWTISDLHLDGKQDKPMDVFGEHWSNHQQRIFDDWKRKVASEDAVLVAGDISWALTLDEVYDDLKSLHELPGEKYFIKGNHDYWWGSLKKINDLNFSSLHFVQNNCFVYGETLIGGTRGWLSPDYPQFDEHDEKIFQRERLRIRNSLTSRPKNIKISRVICMLHYPPFDGKGNPTVHVEEMKAHGVDMCIYGHLHGDGHKYVVEGEVDGIEFICSSADYVSFELVRIGE